ncbi:MAG: hypothetical protein Q9227_008195 [Pyrenula ochraceoflavens]
MATPYATSMTQAHPSDDPRTPLEPTPANSSRPPQNDSFSQMLQEGLQTSPPPLKVADETSADKQTQPRVALDYDTLYRHNLAARHANASSGFPSQSMGVGDHFPTESETPLSHPQTLSPSSEADAYLRRSTSTASLPRRTPSIRTTLYSTAGSLSPGSTISSPQLAAMMDITPLPSPLGVSKDPFGLGLRSRSRASSAASKTESQGDYISAGTINLASPPKRKPYHGLRPESQGAGSTSVHATNNAASHSEQRSISDYKPEALNGPKPRNLAVSTSIPTVDQPPPTAGLHREQYLGEKRGVATPVQKPPTPPASNTSGAASEVDESNLAPKTGSQQFYTATSIVSGHQKRYRSIRLLGQGTFSKVYLAVRQVESGEDDIDWNRESLTLVGAKARSLRAVAIKVVEHGPAGGADEERIEISLKREIEILKSINHPCLVHLKAIGQQDKRSLLVLNYCPGGDLFEFATQRTEYLSPALIRRIFSELVSATRYLHKHFIVHRDIKLESMLALVSVIYVLFNLPLTLLSAVADWQTIDRPVVTLTDLGLSRRIPKPPESPLLQTRCGSEDYAAPELLMGQPYDGRQTDAWALGVLLYALMEGRLPFDPLPNARGDPVKLRARTPHRIARCDWSWYKYGDEDTEWDPQKGKELDGARMCVENLLKRSSRRKPLEDIASTAWVYDGIQVSGGLQRVEEELNRGFAQRKPLDGLNHGSSSDAPPGLNKVSRHVTQPKSQGASQAMLYATGLSETDMDKAQVGISSVWYQGNPCNMHLMDLSNKVKEGVAKAGLVPMQFNTIGVSDAISMGTTGMRYSLQSREIIADSVETVMEGQWYDANISLPGCDKNMPGVVMAMGRVNRPSIMVYGGTIAPGCAKTQNNADIDIISAFQSYGQFLSGEMTEEQRFDVIRHACPGGGACGGMYTANTMASAIEVMGLTLPGSSSNPAESRAKQLECLAAGNAIKNLLTQDIKPSDILTRRAFENAITLVMATGGSTNAVLHLLAIAATVNVPLTIDDFQRISDRTPYLADLKPSGKHVMADLHNIGGTPSLIKYLLAESLLDGSTLTVTGKTLAENVSSMPLFPENQRIIQPVSAPIKPTGHIQILRGTLAPGGAVGKITGKEGLQFKGTARVFDSEDEMVTAFENGQFSTAKAKNEKVVIIIRHEGPKGAPGMPEMLKPSSAIMGAGLGHNVAMITDGRFSGGSHGFLIGHVVPEAVEGGPIALVKDGDAIEIDAVKREVNLLVDAGELEVRKQAYDKAPMRPRARKGTLGKYAKLVGDASHGCITDSG